MTRGLPMCLRPVAAPVIALLLSAAGAAAAETVPIALIEPLSGQFAAIGQNVKRHFDYVAGVANANPRAWGGDGVRFEIVALDAMSTPQDAVAQLRVAIDKGIRYVAQGSSSAVALTLSEAIARHNAANRGREIVFINHGASDLSLTNASCNFWHFRVDANADQKLEALTAYLRDQKSVRKVYLINQDYAFGKAVAASARDLLARKRPDTEIVGDDLHPIGQIRDFAPYMAKVRQSGADTVITGNWGADLALMIKAAREARLAVDFYTLHGATGGVPLALGALGEDRMRTVASWTPNERSFAGAELRDGFSRQYAMDFQLKPAYDSLRLLAEAIRKARSTAPTRVARAMEGLRFRSLNGEVEMRASDHQLQQPLLIASWQRKDAKDVRYDDEKTGFGWKTVSVQPAWVGVQPTSCTMRRPR